MCAIAGIANHHHSSVAKLLIRDMTDAMRHRGPDDSGFYVDRHIALGHRRLKVIDLATGNQPIFNEDRSVAVIFNGEIYNFRQLRAELEKLGHHFRTASDTEVIVHLYEELQQEFVPLLDGMFAFALYDIKRHRLLLGRDRLGQKPLFYFHSGDQLVFASELGALKRHPGMSRELDPGAISDFLSLQYVPGNHTVYRGVRRVPPAHLLDFDLTENRYSLHSYWHTSYAFKCSELSFEEAAHELRQRVEKAVEKRLVSDVPLGVFLSGGMDSAVITGIAAAKLAPGRCQAFSIGFREAAYDESEPARATAGEIGRRCGNLDHLIRTVEPSDFNLLRQLTRHYGEPFADASMLPTALLCRFAREQVTVALSGDGADELFGGYERYLAMRLFDRFSNGMPRSGKYLLGLISGLLPDVGERTFRGRLRRFLRLLSSPQSEAYFNLLNRCSLQRKKRLFGQTWPGICEHDTGEFFRRMRREITGKDPRELYSELDLHSYLPGDILVKVDIAAMSYGLEVRSPFLDREVVEFSARLPWEYKQRKQERKSILRQAFADCLPEAVFTRPKKGFGVPVASYLRGPWKYEAGAMLLEGQLSRSMLNRQDLLAVWKQHQSGQRDWSYLLFNLLMLEFFIASESEH